MSEEHQRQNFSELTDTMLRKTRAEYELLTPFEREWVDKIHSENQPYYEFLAEIVAKVASGQMSDADAQARVDDRRRDQDDELSQQMREKGASPAEIEEAIKESHRRWPAGWWC